MGGKSKLFLKERGVPTIFSFAPETTRKRREYSIKRSEKSAKKLCIEEAISSHETCSSLYRSSCPEVFCKKGILRNFAKFTGKQLCQSLFLNKQLKLAKMT